MTKNQQAKAMLIKKGWKVKQSGNGKYYVVSKHFIAFHKTLLGLNKIVGDQKPF